MRRCRKDLPLEGSPAKRSSSQQSCGTPITGPSAFEPAFTASLDRLKLDYLDLYLIHTPFAFQPGDEQDPRDQNGNVIYDQGVTLLDTWKALETLVDHGNCRAIGLSDITLDKLLPIYESARIKRPWSRSNRIHIFRRPSFWSSARREHSSFGLRAFGSWGCDRAHSKIR